MSEKVQCEKCPVIGLCSPWDVEAGKNCHALPRQDVVRVPQLLCPLAHMVRQLQEFCAEREDYNAGEM